MACCRNSTRVRKIGVALTASLLTAVTVAGTVLYYGPFEGSGDDWMRWSLGKFQQQQSSPQQQQRQQPQLQQQQAPINSRTVFQKPLGSRKLQDWYPSFLKGSGDETEVVLQYVNRSEHRHFLKPDKKTLQKAEGPQSRRMPLKEFVSAVQAGHFGEPAGPIFVGFKVGRCGSTLLDNMLIRDPRFLLVAEPQVINSVTQSLDGDDKKTAALRLQLYQALVMMLAVPLNQEQTVAVLDLNSRSSRFAREIVGALPTAHHFFLWRNPVEVADSFLEKPAWMSRKLSSSQSDAFQKMHRRLVIRNHLESTAAAIDEAVATSTRPPMVFWYQQVLGGLVPQWILNNSFQDAQTQVLQSMLEALKIDAKTHKARENVVDHDELKVPGLLKELGEVWYNKKLVKFRVDHAPTDFDAAKMSQVREIRWPEDKHEVSRHVGGDLSHLPVIVRNAINSTGFRGTRPGEVLAQFKDLVNSVPLLQAYRENQFIWHPNNKKPENYNVYSKWHHHDDVSKGLSIFNKDPRHQVVGGGAKILTRLLPKGGGDMDGPFAVAHRVGGSGDKKKDKASIRLSHSGAVTALHYDKGASMLMQAEGVKEIILWDAKDLDSLYPYGPDHFMHRRCLADPEQPDPTLLPRFNNSVAYRLIIRRGDLAYWPPQWAHYIRTLEGTSVSIGHRHHIRKLSPPRHAPNDLILRVEATRYAKGSGDSGYIDEMNRERGGRTLSESEGLSNDDDDDDHILL